ncbi:ferritin-like domain-containing protein [Macrophomina phaseolina]|uniref:Ferritin-like domain-containing protein n=1 Tax=Macrophomina phaseolina TaxID=35725 RepID=A0ABQ8G489_9PEZI|nr:ferritin-like domain-containing protein [Macrophomina phaseolina]
MVRVYPLVALAAGAAAAPATPAPQIAAIYTTFPSGTEVGAAPPLVTSATTEITSHGPYEGTATTTGAEQGPATLAETVAPKPNPTATYYNPNGKLTAPEAIPYQPGGGVGVDGTLPVYQVQSDFDFESLALGIHQEYIELDLFHYGLAVFSDEEFEEAGLGAEDRKLLEYMAVQEAGHATLLTNMLGEAAPRQCTYDYPFKTVREYVDFMQKLTRWGESGNWGFIGHLDSREAATLLVQAEAIEARQQAIFRQMLGLHPMPIWFAPGIPQSWHWTLLSQYISSCPENNTRVAWQNFPSLHVVNQPNPNRISPNTTAAWETVGNRTGDPSDSNVPASDNCTQDTEIGYSCTPALHHDKFEPLSFPGRQVNLTWDDPGLAVGPNNSYITSTTAGEPTFVAWLGQYNLTYTPLTKTGANSGYTYQPASEVFETDPALNGTAFIAITDSDLFVTPFNLTMVNPHVRALGLYQAG